MRKAYWAVVAAVVVSLVLQALILFETHRAADAAESAASSAHELATREANRDAYGPRPISSGDAYSDHTLEQLGELGRNSPAAKQPE